MPTPALGDSVGITRRTVINASDASVRAASIRVGTKIRVGTSISTRINISTLQADAIEAHVHVDATEIDLDLFGRWQVAQPDLDLERPHRRNPARFDVETHLAAIGKADLAGLAQQIATGIQGRPLAERWMQERPDLDQHHEDHGEGESGCQCPEMSRVLVAHRRLKQGVYAHSS
ncbi:MAG: hypothetical protein ACLFTD_06165, partial [Halochromatium sp.]